MRIRKCIIKSFIFIIFLIVMFIFVTDILEENYNNNESDNTFKKVKISSKNEDFRKKVKDAVGYLYIPDTSIDYPVMQSTPDNPDFFLNHNVFKEYSAYGTPYMSAYCDMNTCDNYIIYGHNINGGRIFGALTKYRENDYYEQHKQIHFITDKDVTYDIIGVMSVNKDTFPYYQFVMAKDEEDYNEYIFQVKKFSLYECNATTEYGKKIITLSTCDNSRGNDYRFVVIGVEH